MRPALPLVLAAALAGPAAAQSCDAPIGPIETCMVGAWIGSSTIPEAMEAFLESMPDNIAASFSDFGRPVGIIIYEDGFFETLPMSAEGWALEELGDGSTAEITMNLQTTTAVGYMSAMGGTIEMCHMPGSGSAIGQMTVATSEGSATSPLAPPPGAMGGPMPPISYGCSGDAMQMVVALPAPIGPITYDMTRVPLSRFPAEFRERVEERYAPAE